MAQEKARWPRSWPVIRIIASPLAKYRWMARIFWNLNPTNARDAVFSWLSSIRAKVGDRHAWNFARILESQEKTASRAFVGFKFQKILAIHRYFASGDAIIRMTGQDVGQRAFS